MKRVSDARICLQLFPKAIEEWIWQPVYLTLAMSEVQETRNCCPILCLSLWERRWVAQSRRLILLLDHSLVCFPLNLNNRGPHCKFEGYALNAAWPWKSREGLGWMPLQAQTSQLCWDESEGGRPPLSEVSFISSIGTTKSTLASMIFGLVLGMLPSLWSYLFLHSTHMWYTYSQNTQSTPCPGV